MRHGSWFYGIIPAAMTIEDIVNSKEFQSVVEDYRGMCLWSLPEDFMPGNERQVHCLVECLEHYGDLNAYRKAGEIRKWLSHVSSRAY